MTCRCASAVFSKSLSARNDRQQRCDFFARGLAAQNQHPFACRIKLIERHLKKTMRDMGGSGHQLLKRPFAETAHDNLGGGHNVIGRAIASGAAHKITGQQQTHHLGAPVLHCLGQSGYA